MILFQQVYSEGILEELLMPPETVEKLFPQLDELIEIHMTFLNNLQELQSRRPDHSVEFIGDTLVHQVFYFSYMYIYMYNLYLYYFCNTGLSTVFLEFMKV